MNDYLIVLLFFLIALFYSSIGFGGGSSYLAILSVLLTDFYEIRSLTLILNLVVVSIGTIMYIQKRVFDWKLFWPFLAFSIPAAFLGSQLRLSEKSFFITLGGALLLSAIMLTIQAFSAYRTSKILTFPKRGLTGFGIGFLSGLTGIGGGIFLSPVLNLFRWANPKTIASLASIFILVNSIAGLTGLAIGGSFEMNWEFAAKIILAVGVGGLIGSFVSNSSINVNVIRGLTALLVTYVGLRIVLIHGWGIRI
ncbi:MAG: sulfite exporter TauE/SafE family protein [Cytophagales bacterium]|nr:sulfite exporter TauE/SafE family protein [Cytophagales bacterium]